MAMPAPDPEETTYVLSVPARLLAQALAPLVQGIRQALTRPVEPSGHQFVLLDDRAKNALESAVVILAH
jgi:hypothetical protein